MHTEFIPDKKTYRKLPTKLYLVRVPIIATYSEEEMVLYGLPADTIDGSPDPKCYENMTASMLNLDKIIGIYQNGFKITIVNQADSAEIFKALEQYLADWNTTKQYSPNMKVDTIDDDRLESIDNLLTEMFDYNRHTIIKSVAGEQMGYSMDMGLMSGMAPRVQTNPNIVNQGGRNMGITAGYDNPQDDIYKPQVTQDQEYYPQTEVSSGSETTYIQPNMPSINMNNVKRTTQVKRGGNITAGYDDIIK